VALPAEPVEAAAAVLLLEDIAVESKVGRSSTSANRSIFRDKSRALRRRSRRAFSERLL
jgi:hypothetical protein